MLTGLLATLLNSHAEVKVVNPIEYLELKQKFGNRAVILEVLPPSPNELQYAGKLKVKIYDETTFSLLAK